MGTSNGILNHILCRRRVPKHLPQPCRPSFRPNKSCTFSPDDNELQAIDSPRWNSMSHSKRIRDSGSRRKSLFLADPQSDSGPEDEFNTIELVCANENSNPMLVF